MNVEKFKVSKTWGRFMLRDAGNTIATGMVLEWIL